MHIPNRADVVRTFSESEAFAHAATLYDDWVTKNTPPPSTALVGELEQRILRPAMELQLAGLSLIKAPDLAEPNHLVVAFASYAVDLQLWGWFAAINFHPRVSFSLIRSALEAVIFGIAAAQDYQSFRAVWNTHQGTGGSVLKQLKHVPEDTRWLLNAAWKIMVELGHASSGPVLSALTAFRDGAEVRHGITFAGQFAGPLDARQLEGCVNAFCITATAATRFFDLSIIPLLSASDEWLRRYQQLQQQLDTIVPVPGNLSEYVETQRKKFGNRPKP